MAEEHTILIVEDQGYCATTLEIGFLALPGVDVRIIAFAAEALELLHSTEVSIRVTDLRLPYMDGFQLISSVRSDTRTKSLSAGTCDLPRCKCMLWKALLAGIGLSQSGAIIGFEGNARFGLTALGKGGFRDAMNNFGRSLSSDGHHFARSLQPRQDGGTCYGEGAQGVTDEEL
jgi:hypothetical protein